MIRRRRKKQVASSSSELLYSKQKQTLKSNELTAQEFQDLHKGSEKSLQEACENYLLLNGWERCGLVGNHRIDIQGVFFHVHESAFYTIPQDANPYSVSNNLKNLPDLMLLRRDGQFKAIELKSKVGRLSRGQRCLSGIIPIVLCRSIEQFEKELKEFSL